MGCYATENLSPVTQDIKFRLMQAFPIPCFSLLLYPLPLYLSLSLSHVHIHHNSVAQLTLQKPAGCECSEPCMALLKDRSHLIFHLPPPTTHTDLACQVLTACFIWWPSPVLCLKVMLSLCYFFILCFLWIRVTLAKLSWSIVFAREVQSWPGHPAVSFQASVRAYACLTAIEKWTQIKEACEEH